jgi:hypothetical protein
MSFSKDGDNDFDLIESLLENSEFLELILKGELDAEFLEVRQDLESGRFKCHSNRTAAPRHRNKCYALEEMEYLSDSLFKRMFRLTRNAFNFLLEKLRPAIESKPSLNHIYHHKDREISPTTRLAATLRWLAGGSYLDICFAFGISVGSLYKDSGILWGTIAAINDALEIGFPLNDPRALEEISEGFAKFSYGRMRGCVMAIDGLVIRTRMPTRAEVLNQRCYMNRKDFWGILVFAGCDHRCKFNMFSANYPGATNDSLAWPMTSFYNAVIAPGLLPRQYYIICDEAVSSTEEVLCPYGGKALGVAKDSFNFHLSVMRQCIERAFGILVQRWGILWRDLACAQSRWALVATVCAKLHNLCIDFGVDVAGNGSQRDTVVETMPEDFEEDDLAMTFLNEYNAENGGELPDNAENRSMRRRQITAWLKEQGYRRPDHSRNSKA